MTMAVGEVSIIAMSDGEFTMPRSFLSAPDAYDDLAGTDGQVRLPVGCFLFPGEHPVLVDVGFGPGPPTTVSGGNLLRQLRAVGCEPDQVEVVALTHLHPDHVGWLATADGWRPFAGARVLIGEGDWNYFVRDGRGEMDAHIRSALADLRAGGTLELLAGEQSITPYLTALPAPGHTPGHTVFAVHDHGERAVLLGDSFYCPQQLHHSDWAAISDVDAALATRTREALERDLDQHNSLAIGAHFPGLEAGRLLRS